MESSLQECDDSTITTSTEDQAIVPMEMEEAERLFEEGEYKEAFKIYKECRDKLISSKEELAPELDIILHNRMGSCLLSTKEFDEAKLYLLKAEELQNTLDPDDKISLVSIKIDCGKIYDIEKDSDQVENTFNTCLELLKEIPKIAEEDLIRCYNKFADFCLGIERKDEAYEFASEALRLNNSITDSPNETPELAISFHILGAFHLSLDKLNDARDCYTNCLNIRENLNFPKNHLDIYLLYGTLGRVCLDLKEYKKAIYYLYPFVEIMREIHGENYHVLSRVYYDIGRAQHGVGELDDALESLNKSMDVHKKAFGETKEGDTAMIYEEIGKVLFLQEDYLEAIKNFEQALKINLKTCGENSIAASNNYYQLGDLYLDRFGFKNAGTNLNKALQIRLKHPKEKLLIAECESRIGALYTWQKKHYKSLAIQMKAFKTIRHCVGQYNNNRAAASIKELSILFDRTNDLASSESCNKRVRVLERKVDCEIDYEASEDLFEIEQTKSLVDLNKFDIY